MFFPTPIPLCFRAPLSLASFLHGRVTDEPGIYFIPTLIDLWKAEGKFKEFINYDKLETYKDFGGIRIEDDLLITADGNRILGRPIPKTVEEVEAMCAQGREWIKMTAMY